MKFLNLDIRRARPRAINTVLKEHFGNREITGAEIGVWKGKNAKEILENLRIKWLYLIDPYEDYNGYNRIDKDDLNKIEKNAKIRLENFNDRVWWIKDISNALNIILPLDFVYIDGNHAFGYIAMDLAVWVDKIKKGGIIAGHDYFSTGGDRRLRSVGRIVDAFAQVYDFSNWYVLGRPTDKIHDRELSYFFIKHW